MTTNQTRTRPLKAACLALLNRIFIGRARRALLEDYGWYRNMAGGWTHPHCMDFMSRREILRCTPDELNYKMQYGSRSIMPGKETACHG